ncbi:MAG: 1-acyl-sn-glycerol-3-phosphate acyltransferase, partial [Actinomycetota bacterium]|nr:1-acyl-sn-glycerol-3-phosphate acyltransferase [Actinomycetota bacterium]
MATPAELDIAWTRNRAATRLRELLICGLLGPLMDLYTRRRVTGREHLNSHAGPVVFVANHNSHMDTPVMLRALPGRWRRRTAVAAAADYFYAKRRNALSASLV